jgi:hypothetical protein
MEMPQWMHGVHTSYPAKVVSFDPVRQSVKVRLLIERYYSNLDELNTQVPPLVLIDVPAYFPKVKGFSITMKPEEGDTCLVFFAEKGVEHWLYEGKEIAGLSELGIPHADHRELYSINSAFAYFGFSDFTDPITDFNTEGLDIRNADRTQRITLKEDNTIEMDTTASIDITASEINLTATGKVNIKGATVHINEPGNLQLVTSNGLEVCDANGLLVCVKEF